MNNFSPTARATTLVLATALISGTANFINKFAVGAFSNPVFFTTLKNVLVAAVLIGVILVAKRLPEIRSLTRAQWGRLIAIGVIGGSLPFALFFTGLAQTSAVAGGLIHKTLFIWVALLAIPFLKERLAWQQWVGVAVIFGANLAIPGFTGFKWNAGELMILVATLLWAVENVIAKKALADISALTVAGARMVFGSLILLSYVNTLGATEPLTGLSAAQWGWTLATALLLTGYVTTWYTALKLAPASYVATLLVPAILVTNILSAVFVTHKWSGLATVSALGYLIGATLVIAFARRAADANTVAVPTV